MGGPRHIHCKSHPNVEKSMADLTCPSSFEKMLVVSLKLSDSACRKDVCILIQLYEKTLLRHKLVSSAVISLSADEQGTEIKYDSE